MHLFNIDIFFINNMESAYLLKTKTTHFMTDFDGIFIRQSDS
jgi:hypothetical protein